MVLFVLGHLPAVRVAFMPIPLFEPFNPKGSTPDGIKPEWYFYFVYYPLEMLPFWVILLGSAVAGGGAAGHPVDLPRTPTAGRSALLAICGGLYLVIMTVFGEQHLPHVQRMNS